MTTDNPDTVAMDEDPTHWASTQVDDVFQPSVRVQVGWADVEAAVESGAIVPTQAHQLWAGWAMPGGPTRVTASGSPAPVSAAGSDEGQRGADAGMRPIPPASRNGGGSGSSLPSVLSLVAAFVLGAVVVYVALSLK